MSRGERLMEKRIEAMAAVIGAARCVVEYPSDGARLTVLARSLWRLDAAIRRCDEAVGDRSQRSSGSREES